ncbi:MAG: glycosyltransferase [Candidatus Thermoplasmatota archaeon]|nr:glycosyltransferase [Candidatus Thermoplasmatota archaeon]
MQLIAEKEKITNVNFLPPYPPDKIPLFFSLATASIVTLRKLELFKGSRPAKIFSSMACGVPVIYSGEGEGAKLIEEGNCGIVVEPENPRALASAVAKLADDKELAYELGQNGRRLAEREYSWDIIIDRWLRELKKE